MRRTEWARALNKETSLNPQDFILPIFIKDVASDYEPISTMPGIYRHSIASAIKMAKQAYSAGIMNICLFPSVDASKKTSDGKEAYNSNNLVCNAVREIKNSLPEIGIMCDVALDPYTTHGHDGIIKNGDVHNDSTIEALVKQSIALVDAGCDILGPSDMMDGRIQAIRMKLEETGNNNTVIISYSAKYASCFYAPFRDAVESSGNLTSSNTNSFSDSKQPENSIGSSKNTYQMDPANIREALLEAKLDMNEGADIIMVKPAMQYLDVIHSIRNNFPSTKVAAYQVSGEYAMLKNAISQGLLPEYAIEESLLSIKRAGADIIISYAALELFG